MSAPSRLCIPEWFKIGSGVSNYLAVPDLPLDSTGTAYDLPGGYIMNGNIAGVHPFKTAVGQGISGWRSAKM